MDFSGEMNKPIGYDTNGQYAYPSDLIKSQELKKNLAALYAYLAQKLQIGQVPKVIFKKDKQNSEKEFGLTGYYDPESQTISLFITGRHNTDILRSFAHEVIHHWQNLTGTLKPKDQEADNKSHYAQENPHLRKQEMEAYLFGNILFRDWQDFMRMGPPAQEPLMPQRINESKRR